MKEIEKLMKKAKRYIDIAERDLNAGDHFASVSRSYYAMFTAVRAMLLKKGITTDTHREVIKKFKEEHIKTGLFSEELGKAFGYVESLREIGDYGTSMSDIDREDSEKALNYANRFVEEAEKYLEREKEREREQGIEEVEEEEMESIMDEEYLKDLIAGEIYSLVLKKEMKLPLEKKYLIVEFSKDGKIEMVRLSDTEKREPRVITVEVKEKDGIDYYILLLNRGRAISVDVEGIDNGRDLLMKIRDTLDDEELDIDMSYWKLVANVYDWVWYGDEEEEPKQ